MSNTQENSHQTPLGAPPTGGTVQVGTIVAYLGKTIPETWLLCDGTKIPDKYNALIGLTGPNTPNLAGRTLIGTGTGQDSTGTARTFTLGEANGEYSNTLTIEQMPKHNHYLIFANTGGHTNPQTANWDTKNLTSDNDYTSDTGGGQPHNNLQPYYAINYIIYAGTS
jgi:microcystin-dependent protein